MAVYNPKSLKAEEFINDAEIRETIAYAQANKRNAKLIDALLEKARPKKSGSGVTCAGLTHREASVLLACDLPDKIEAMYRLANEIKLAFYGNRIVMFAPKSSPCRIWGTSGWPLKPVRTPSTIRSSISSNA